MSQLEGYFVVEYEAILHCKDDARKEPVFWCLLSCHPSCMVVTYRECFENESSACQETRGNHSSVFKAVLRPVLIFVLSPVLIFVLKPPENRLDGLHGKTLRSLNNH